MDIMTRIENEFRKLHRILMGVVVISMLSFIMLQFHRESHIFADTSICDQNYGNASAPSSFCSPQNRQDLNQNPLKPTRPHSIKKERSNLRISWVPYGQFNNNLMIFARMCLLAERTGRKLLVPRDFVSAISDRSTRHATAAIPTATDRHRTDRTQVIKTPFHVWIYH